MAYRVPKKQQGFETEVKRSRFITTIAPITSKTEAKQLIHTLQKKFPDANHHCWAMILGGPKDSYGQDQSDDGEPKGTAGKPILNVLQHSDLGHVMAVVTRYFGGIKLGAGGLVRAYSNAVSEALKELETVEFLQKEQASLSLPYSLLDTLKYHFAQTRIQIMTELYTESINLTVEFPIEDKDLLMEIIDTIGQGQISYSGKE